MIKITLSLFKKQLSNNFTYQSFGLNIQSSFKLPELHEADFPEENSHVFISHGVNPTEIEYPVEVGLLFQAKKDQFLLKLDSIGSYYVTKGDTITVERFGNPSDDEIRLFLLGSAFGALLHQRMMLPIHASSIVRNGLAILFGGVSGVGKSSLAATLSKRGYFTLSDDISVLEIIDRQVYVLPGIPQFKLWKDVLDIMGEDVKSLKKVRPQLLKYEKRFDNNHISVKIPLNSIIVINIKRSPGIRITEVRGVEKINLLMKCVFRYQYINGLQQTENVFQMIIKLASVIKVFHLQRPSSPLLIDDLADFVENYS